LLQAAELISLSQDARDAEVVILVKGLAPKFPKKLTGLPVDGIQAMTPDGPWVFNCLLSIWRMGSSRDATDVAQGVLTALQGFADGEEEFAQLKAKVRFFCHDNAADEGRAYELLGTHLPGLRYDMPDTTHSRQLVLKNCLRGDSEIEKTQELLVTGKVPEPSVANFLSYSHRFSSKFQEAEKTLV